MSHQAETLVKPPSPVINQGFQPGFGSGLGYSNQPHIGGISVELVRPVVPHVSQLSWAEPPVVGAFTSPISHSNSVLERPYEQFPNRNMPHIEPTCVSQTGFWGHAPSQYPSMWQPTNDTCNYDRQGSPISSQY